jgi:hypothetical protein
VNIDRTTQAVWYAIPGKHSTIASTYYDRKLAKKL